uniref:NADH-ubiquinone oxidoreductase chain 4L n=1 Tax=Champsodon cf. snyderi CBM-ZF 10876 TaxID=270612 RepID=T2HVQ2_9TELE|nr:NADH dehydrogenase subunit 4L [Champsodon cf. snyderi CBM-ZF 10876]BAN83378.1 NADH dehydrogenase subunit 4L [Champsodon cf. snyderi CBM-ZF 10876]
MTTSHLALSSAFILGLTGLTFYRTHLLSALLCLESMMLSLFIILSLWSLQLNSANFSASPLLLLVFSACEASVGLALLVATTRTHGSDHINNLNLLQC